MGFRKAIEVTAHILGKEYCEWHDGIVDEVHQYVDPDSGITTLNWCNECASEACHCNNWVRMRSSQDPKE